MLDKYITWKTETVSQSQLIYIKMMQKDNPELPPFTGKTKGEASEYIDKYKKRKQNGRVFSTPKRFVHY